MFLNQWITKETVSKLIIPHSKMIQGAFAIEFNKMLESNNWIGNIVLEENIIVKDINFFLIINKYINKYNWNYYSYDLTSQVYFQHNNNTYLESYLKNFNQNAMMFNEKYYGVKNNKIYYNNKIVNEVKKIL
jgi:hypothetical protein